MRRMQGVPWRFTRQSRDSPLSALVLLPSFLTKVFLF